MVASQCLQIPGNTVRKAFQDEVVLSMGPPDAFSAAPVDFELDFNDVFGAAPQVSPAFNIDDLVYDEPEVICSRSHSLVGPTTFTSQSMKLSKITLHETEYDLVEGVNTMALEDHEKTTLILNDDDGNLLNNSSVGLDDFEVLKVVGQGAFAKVFQVRKHGSSEIFAMKVMRKDRIFEKDHAEYMKAERDILTKVDHPFIVQLKYSFQTKHRLFLVLDFINGGHLFFQLYRQGLFREDLARFYTAEIVSAVSHLHANGIMHRDLKPENILLDAEGHVMLTDFGVAKEFDESTRSNSMCGTLEYMSPEIVHGRGHDKAADWWSVGILMYEMLTGKPPFRGGNRQKIQQQIVKDKIKLPAFLSSEAHSLLKGLLQKESSRRLGSGSGGSNEIKSHSWFKSINWKKLEGREIKPSFVPQVAGKQCIANFEECWTNLPPVLDSPAASPKYNDNPFKGFTYVRPRFLEKDE
ncbi:serine/threonine-protein kinase AtPK2/AtPK19-like [Rutidosis leptorrhynchoides]|uniref:serine/threonine-protein kinase AtPK2/AtPK19-like n=1 Tax=Rutidosis leptorrhynchoides TaxID=125765 RepID=UPI003A993EF4